MANVVKQKTEDLFEAVKAPLEEKIKKLKKKDTRRLEEIERLKEELSKSDKRRRDEINSLKHDAVKRDKQWAEEIETLKEEASKKDKRRVAEIRNLKEEASSNAKRHREEIDILKEEIAEKDVKLEEHLQKIEAFEVEVERQDEEFVEVCRETVSYRKRLLALMAENENLSRKLRESQEELSKIKGDQSKNAGNLRAFRAKWDPGFKLVSELPMANDGDENLLEVKKLIYEQLQRSSSETARLVEMGLNFFGNGEEEMVGDAGAVCGSDNDEDDLPVLRRYGKCSNSRKKSSGFTETRTEHGDNFSGKSSSAQRPHRKRSASSQNKPSAAEEMEDSDNLSFDEESRVLDVEGTSRMRRSSGNPLTKKRRVVTRFCASNEDQKRQRTPDGILSDEESLNGNDSSHESTELFEACDPDSAANKANQVFLKFANEVLSSGRQPDAFQLYKQIREFISYESPTKNKCPLCPNVATQFKQHLVNVHGGKFFLAGKFPSVPEEIFNEYFRQTLSGLCEEAKEAGGSETKYSCQFCDKLKSTKEYNIKPHFVLCHWGTVRSKLIQIQSEYGHPNEISSAQEAGSSGQPAAVLSDILSVNLGSFGFRALRRIFQSSKTGSQVVCQFCQATFSAEQPQKFYVHLSDIHPEHIRDKEKKRRPSHVSSAEYSKICQKVVESEVVSSGNNFMCRFCGCQHIQQCYLKLHLMLIHLDILHETVVKECEKEASANYQGNLIRNTEPENASGLGNNCTGSSRVADSEDRMSDSGLLFGDKEVVINGQTFTCQEVISHDTENTDNGGIPLAEASLLNEDYKDVIINETEVNLPVDQVP